MSNYYMETFAVTQRILTELWRRKRSLGFWCIFPVIVLFLNGYIFAARSRFPLAKAMEYAAPATLVGVAFFFSCLGGSVATVVREREQHTLKRLFISPLKGISYFLGVFFAHSCIAIVQTLLVYLIANLLGAKFEGSIFLAIIIIILSIISYVGMGFLLGTQLAKRTEDVNTIVATFGVPLLILGGAFLPAFLFPKNLLSLAKYNPIYHITEALIAVWSKGDSVNMIQDHLQFLTIFAGIMIVLAWFSYNRMLEVERRL